ncbi:MAG: MFS transporter [Burkholderiales bacterium]|nr:MFS transporter [Burkholderiales bacterium]
MTMTAPTRPAPAARPQRWILASLCLTMLMPSLDTSIANAGLPALARALGAGFAHAQWVVLAYLLAITSLIVGAGRLGDLFGRRRLLIAGIALFTAASLACGLAGSLEALVAARALQGLGAAAMLALAVALVGETIPKAHTGRAMGLLGTMSAIGTTLGPSLGGVLMAAAGWRSIFLVNVPLGVLNLWLAWRWLPAPPRDAAAPRPRFDLAGTAALALGLAAYALAMTARQPQLLAVAGAGAAAFVAIEARAAAPLVRLAMLREPRLASGLAASMLVATVIMTTLVVGPFHLTRALGLPPATLGLVLSVGPMVSALTGAPAGRLVDRVGAPRVMLGGLVAMLAGAVALAIVPAAAGVPGYLGALLVMTIGYASFQPANNTALMAGIDAGRRGVVSGLLNLSRHLGLITGASAMGAVFAAVAGDATTSGAVAVARGTHAAFGVAAGLLVVALAVTLLGRALAPSDASGAAASPGLSSG